MRVPFPLKAGFVRDSAALIAGAGIAQLAIVAATPLITRLYDQADLGVLAAFIALTALVGQIGCLRYEQAIMIASEDEVPALIRLSMAVNVLVALVLCLLIWVQGESLLKWCSLESIAAWIWLAPPVVLGLGISQLLQVLLTRRRKFASQFQARVGKSVFEVVSQIAAALVTATSGIGLLLGYTLGVVAQAAWLTTGAAQTRQEFPRQQAVGPTMVAVARRYSRFPIFAVPHGLASTLNSQGFSLLLAAVISPQIAGLFYLTHRLLAAPTALISQALAPVFYQRLSSRRSQPARAQQLIASVFVGLLILGALPLISIAAMGPWLFRECFGPEWTESGRIVRFVWPTYLMAFCVAPITQVFYAYEKQALGLVWQLWSVAIRFAAVYLAYCWSGAEGAFLAYGVVGVLAYAVVIVMALQLAGCQLNELPKAIAAGFWTIVTRLSQKEAAPA